MKKKDKFFTKQNVVSLFIVFLMVSSIIGFMSGSDDQQTNEYNGHKIISVGNAWEINIEGEEYSFNFFPTEVENIDMDFGIIEKLSNKVEIDSTYDEDVEAAEAIALTSFSLDKELKQTFFRNGMTNANKYSLPIITCEDATQEIPVIYFKEGNRTQIRLQGECIIAQGEEPVDFIKIKDRILYGIIGVI